MAKLAEISQWLFISPSVSCSVFNLHPRLEEEPKQGWMWLIGERKCSGREYEKQPQTQYANATGWDTTCTQGTQCYLNPTDPQRAWIQFGKVLSLHKWLILGRKKQQAAAIVAVAMSPRVSRNWALAHRYLSTCVGWSRPCVVPVITAWWRCISMSDLHFSQDPKAAPTLYPRLPPKSLPAGHITLALVYKVDSILFIITLGWMLPE